MSCFPPLLTARWGTPSDLRYTSPIGTYPIGGPTVLKDAALVPYIPVSDVARARRFYEQKVGLKPKEEYAGGVIYECGKGSWVFMYPSAGARSEERRVGKERR